MKALIVVVVVLIILLAIGWLGLRVNPRPFASYPEHTPTLATMPLPDDLPAPVDRYFRRLYGDEVPVITSAVISGRAEIRPFGVTLPARYRFTHEAGQAYRHYIEATFFGLPFMRVNEHYLDGHARLEIPIIGNSEGPHTDQAANLGLWAESTLLPAILITDPRVRWEPVDAQNALLNIPFGEEEQQFLVRFDAETGDLARMEAMRYRDEQSEQILWLADTLPGRTIEAGGAVLQAVGTATWADQGRPWAIFTAEEVIYNVDVTDYIRASGP